MIEITGEDRYAFTHGKKTTGRGAWWFCSEQEIDWKKHLPDRDYFQTPGGTLYTEAKKRARQWAKRQGHTAIYVMT